MVLLFYTTYISVDHAHHEILRAKVGKGLIKTSVEWAFLQVGMKCETKVI